MRRKMVILNYSLPIENLDALSRSVKPPDRYHKKTEIISVQFRGLHPQAPDA